MTAAQQDALDKCQELLSEHFEAFVLVTVDNEGGHADARTTHHGGFHTALGLLADAQDSYLRRDFE